MIFTDNFTRTDRSLNGDNGWSTYGNDVLIRSGRAIAETPDSLDDLGYPRHFVYGFPDPALALRAGAEDTGVWHCQANFRWGGNSSSAYASLILRGDEFGDTGLQLLMGQNSASVFQWTPAADGFGEYIQLNGWTAFSTPRSIDTLVKLSYTTADKKVRVYRNGVLWAELNDSDAYWDNVVRSYPLSTKSGFALFGQSSIPTSEPDTARSQFVEVRNFSASATDPRALTGGLRKPPSQRNMEFASVRQMRALQIMTPGSMAGRVANASLIAQNTEFTAAGTTSQISDMIFSHAGEIVDGVWSSPYRVTVEAATLTSIHATLGSVGSTSTTVQVSLNGTTFVTVTIPPGASVADVEISEDVVVDDLVRVMAFAVGTGAQSLTIQLMTT